MSKRYDYVKRLYDNHIWGKSRVRKAVEYEWITPEEYETIVGEPYDNA